MPYVMAQAADRGHLHRRRRRAGRPARQHTHPGGYAARRRSELRLQRCISSLCRLFIYYDGNTSLLLPCIKWTIH